MKKRLPINIACFLAVFSLMFLMNTGCSDDFFADKDGDRITPDQHYRTIQDAEASLMGAIVPLQDIMPSLIILDGLRSDMMDITPNADANMRSINDQIFAIDNPLTDPADLYKVIININEVLANIDKVAKVDRQFNELIAHQVKGALVGMRAWTYLTLVQLYGKAVWIEDNLASLPPNLNQEVLLKDQIIDILIEQLIPYIQNDPNVIELRIGYYVNTKALLGELYLEKNDYANAVEYLKLACESFQNPPALFKVDRTYQNAGWSAIFLNSESASIENISVIPFSSREDQYNPLAYWMGYNFQYVVKPSKVLVDSFMVQLPATGAPGDLWRGHGVTFKLDTLAQLTDTTYLTTPYITKYEVDVSDPFSSDIIISRTADIHLKLAEALNRLGDDASQNLALVLMNNGINGMSPKPAQWIGGWTTNLGVRGRVFLKARTVPVELTGEEKTRFIEDLIMAERAMELAFEGKRWNDLVRVANRRNEPEFLADKVAAKFEGTAQYDMIRAKLMNPANWYLPWE